MKYIFSKIHLYFKIDSDNKIWFLFSGGVTLNG